MPVKSCHASILLTQNRANLHLSLWWAVLTDELYDRSHQISWGNTHNTALLLCSYPLCPILLYCTVLSKFSNPRSSPLGLFVSLDPHKLLSHQHFTNKTEQTYVVQKIIISYHNIVTSERIQIINKATCIPWPHIKRGRSPRSHHTL